jgi:hypothetical protein
MTMGIYKIANLLNNKGRSSKLTNDQIEEAKILLAIGYSCRHIGRLLNCSYMVIVNVRDGIVTKGVQSFL